MWIPRKHHTVTAHQRNRAAIFDHDTLVQVFEILQFNRSYQQTKLLTVARRDPAGDNNVPALACDAMEGAAHVRRKLPIRGKRTDVVAIRNVDARCRPGFGAVEDRKS